MKEKSKDAGVGTEAGDYLRVLMNVYDGGRRGA